MVAAGERVVSWVVIVHKKRETLFQLNSIIPPSSIAEVYCLPSPLTRIEPLNGVDEIAEQFDTKRQEVKGD